MDYYDLIIICFCICYVYLYLLWVWICYSEVNILVVSSAADWRQNDLHFGHAIFRGVHTGLVLMFKMC